MRQIVIAVAVLLSMTGCQPSTQSDAGTPSEVAASRDVHPFRIGQLQAWALRDGTISLPVGGDALPWSDRAAVVAALSGAGQRTDVVDLSVQPLLVRDGERLVLIDTGAGGQMGTQNLLLASLAAAGFEPADITDILISHAHGDHIGGLVNPQGALVFANAAIRISAPEWSAMQAEAPAALIAAITPRVQAFAPGAQLTPSITAIPLAGHTPGHTGFEAASGEERLLYIGDALHSSVLSVGHPDWANAWDTDSAAGVATRRRLLDEGAADSRIIYGVHFPFPGRGRFQAQGDAFVWMPEG